LIIDSYYKQGFSYFESGEFYLAAQSFDETNGYSDSDIMILEAGKELLKSQDYETSIKVFDMSSDNQKRSMERNKHRSVVSLDRVYQLHLFHVS